MKALTDTHSATRWPRFGSWLRVLWLVLLLGALSPAHALIDVNKAFVPINGPVGQTATLTIGLFNSNVVIATSAAMTDTLPAGITVNSVGSNSCGGTLSSTGTQLRLTGGTIPAATGAGQGSCSVTAVVSTTAPGSHVNTILTTDVSTSQGNAIQNAQATMTANPLTGLTGSKAVPVSTTLHGNGTRNFVITLNNANLIPMTNVGFTDTLPATLRIGPGGLLSNTCGGTVLNTASGAVALNDAGIKLSGGTIPAGGSCAISFEVKPTNDGAVANGTTATNSIPINGITTTEGVSNAAALSASITLRTGGVVAKAFSPATIAPGATSNLTLTLSNRNLNTVTVTSLTDNLPANTTATALVSNSCGGSLNAFPATSITLTGGTIPPATNPTTNSTGSCAIVVAVTAATAGGYTNSIPAGTFNAAPINYNAANATLTVSSTPPPVSAGKAFAPSTILTSGTSLLTITLSNSSASTATINSFAEDLLSMGNVAVRIIASPLPSTTCGGTLTAVAGTTTISLSGGSIPAAGNCLIRVAVQAETYGVGVRGARTNTINSGALDTDLGGNPNAATAVLTINSPVSLSKAFSPNTVVSTGQSVLTITLSNAGTVPAAITSFSDDLLTMGNIAVRIAASPSASTNCGGTLTAVAGTTTVSLAGGIIPAGSTCQITVPVQAEPNGVTGNRTNTLPIGRLVTSVGNNDSAATAALTINAALTAAKAFFPTTIAPSGSSRLTVTISHGNGAVAFTNLSFTDPLPAGHTVDTPANVVSTCGGTVTATPGAATFSLSGGSLSTGASSCIVALDIQAPVGTGTSTNTIPSGSFTTAEGVTSRSAVTAALTRTTSGGPVTLNKSFLPTSINGGGLSMLSITIANNNAGAIDLTSVNLTDALPTGMLIASPPLPSFTGTGCSGGSITATPNAAFTTLSGASITAGSSCVLSVQVTGVQDGNLINSIPVSTLTSAQGVTNNNNPAATLTVLRNMAIDKVFLPDTITQSGTSTLMLSLINTNDVARTGTPTNTFTDNLPAGVTLASGVSTNNCGGSLTNGTGGALAAGNTSLRLNGGAFPARSVCTLTVVVTSASSGTYSNVIAAGAITTVEGSTNPDPATATLAVITLPTIAKAFNPASIAAAQGSTLTFTLTNPNSAALLPGGLTGASFTDNLPAGMSVMLSGPAGGTCSGASSNLLSAGATTLSLSGLTLAAGASCTVTLPVNASVAGTYPNVSSGIITTLTPVRGTPSSTATLTVLAAPTLGKSFSPSTLLSGGSGTTLLTLTVNNPNSTALNLGTPTAALTDVFPTSPGAMVVASPLTTSNTCGSTLRDSGGGTLAAGDVGIQLIGGTVPANGACSVSVVVSVSTPGNYLNTSSAVSSLNAGSSAAATASFTVTPAADLRVSKTNGVSTLATGQTTSYTITVNNLGPASGSGTTVTDPAVTGLSCTALSCSAANGAACPAGVMSPATLQSSGYVIPALPVSGSVSFVLECLVTASGL